MVVMIHGKHITDEGCEIVMAFLNMALIYCNKEYRFPVRAQTFVEWCQLAERIHHGMKSYVSCTKCHAVHAYETEDEKRRIFGRKCTSVEPFPGSVRCNAELFVSNAKKIMKPIRMVYYNSIISTLKTFFMRDTFADDLKGWKTRLTVPGLMSDLYDGRVWNTFKINPEDNTPFVFLSDYNLMLTVNVDWFQLYTNSNYSCGGIYLTVQNLPREIRNLRKNVLLCCVLPGPHEPQTFQMNHYLRLLVDELRLLIPGVEIKTKHHGIQTIRAALTMVACDLPAARKVIGMTSHNSTYACSKCDHAFENVPGHEHNRDFSNGPYADTWIPRDNATHRRNAQLWLQGSTLSARTAMEKKTGTRWSVLLDLEYFDPTRFVIFDICHNTFMGTALRMMRVIWRNEKLLVQGQSGALVTKDHIKEMSGVLASSFVLPLSYDGQSIARKIKTGPIGFSHMKSDEYKIWCLALSQYCLSTRLPSAFYHHWIEFVNANRYLASPTISLEDVETMNGHMEKFVKDFMTHYQNPLYMVSNMHYHLHLRETLLDYGPGPSSWIFNFERYNCDIKNIKTNRKGDVEKIYMKKFLRMVHADDYFESLNAHSIVGSEMKLDLQGLFSGGDIHGYKMVKENVYAEYLDAKKEFSLVEYIALNHGHKVAYGYEQLPPSAVKTLNLKPVSILNSHFFKCLLEYYNGQYDQEFYASTTTAKVCRFIKLDLFGDVYRSMESSNLNARGSYIRAFYRLDFDEDMDCDDETDQSQSLRHYHTISESGELRPAQVLFFLDMKLNF